MDENGANPLDSGENEPSLGKSGGLDRRRDRARLVFLVLAGLMALSLAAGVWLFVERRRLKDDVHRLETTYSPMFLQINTLTVARFEKMVASGEAFLVNISRPSCPFCRAIDPAFSSLVEELRLQESIYYVNVESVRGNPVNEEVWLPFKEKYGFFYTPAFVRYEGGQVVSLLEGEFDEARLRQWLVDNRLD